MPSRTHHPLAVRLLRAYFYSGWTFLIPYVAVYLVYYWTKWPAIPPEAGQPTPASTAPCLLYVYWGLHVVHVALAVFTLRNWWHSPERVHAGSFVAGKLRALRAGSNNRCVLRAIIPWFFLGLLFYIPGVYFEWPADPWEHLSRINDWRVEGTVGAHYAWFKSSYFMEYSLLGWATSLRQLFWIDIYNTAASLLLGWQYYRLARTCQLNARVSTIFVLFQAICSGNSVFSFYRYYGISSSIYAQLGAVAITRVISEVAFRGATISRNSNPDRKSVV